MLKTCSADALPACNDDDGGAAAGGRLVKYQHHNTQILLPSARHLEEGRGTTEAGKVHKRVVPQPPWEPPPPQHPNRVKNT